MKNIYLILSFLISFTTFSQVCNIDYSQTSPGAYPATLANGMVGVPYNGNLTIVFPQSGNSVNYTSFKIKSVSLPLGLTWECNEASSGCQYDPQQSPYACLSIYGTPAEKGVYTIEVLSEAEQTGGIKSVYSVQSAITIDSSSASNTLYSFAPSSACESASVQFTLNNPINYTPIAGQTTGISHAWNFGNGMTSNAANPPIQTYNSVGDYEVTYQQTIDTVGFKLTNVTINAVGCSDAVGYGSPDIYIEVFDGSGYLVYTNQAQNNDGSLPMTFTTNILLNNPPYKIKVLDDDSDNLWGTTSDNCIDNSEDQSLSTNISLPAVSAYGLTTQSATNGSLNFNYGINKDVITNTAIDTVRIHANPNVPVLTFTAGTPAELSTTDNGDVYQWLRNGAMDYQYKGASIFPEHGGDYAVIAVNNYGCYSQSTIQHVDVAGLEPLDENYFSLYPNPASESITITFPNPENDGLISIYDLTGRLYNSNPIHEYNSVINLQVNKLNEGLYFVSFTDKNGRTLNKKLTISK